MTIERLVPGSDLQAFPPAEKWDDWREYDVSQWPRRVEKRFGPVDEVDIAGILARVRALPANGGSKTAGRRVPLDAAEIRRRMRMAAVSTGSALPRRGSVVR